VKDQLVARDFTPLANFAMGEFQQIIPGMSRLRPARHLVTRSSGANNVARISGANEAIIQLVKGSMSRLATTMKEHLDFVAKGQPAPALGQPGVPSAQVIVLRLLLPLASPIQ